MHFLTSAEGRLAQALKEDTEGLVAAEKQDYDAFVGSEAASGPVELDMVMKIVDGDELIADSSRDGGFLAACQQFEAFLAKRAAAA